MMTGIYAHEVFKMLPELADVMTKVKYASVVVSCNIGLGKFADEV